MTRGKPKSFDRNEVLTKAMETFWSKGYEATGMTELLEEMGIQRQSFYNEFHSKAQVYEEAIDLYCDTILGKIAAELNKSGNPLQNIEDVFRFWEQMAPHPNSPGCLVGNSIAETGPQQEKLSKKLSGRIRQMEDAFYRTLKRAADEGALPPDRDPRALARTIVATSQGLALLSRVGVGKPMFNDVVKTLKSMLYAEM
jgi:TetR/AcrR family transcriptional repressor of nem operon